MGPDQRVHFVEYLTWDEAAGAYRGWVFTGMGEFGESRITPQADGTFLVEASRKLPDGTERSGSGTWRFPDEDTLRWSWKEPFGDDELRMEVTNRRM